MLHHSSNVWRLRLQRFLTEQVGLTANLFGLVHSPDHHPYGGNPYLIVWS